MAHSKETENLLRALPDFFPKHGETNNAKLLGAIGDQVDYLQADLDEASDASRVQTARTRAQLRELAKLVNLPPRQGENRETFRARTIAEFQLTTSEGTADDLITSLSVILGVDQRQIEYRDADEPGVAIVGMPLQGIDKLDMETGDLIDIIQNNAPAGYRIEASVRGTFTYRTVEEHDLGDTDPDAGYDELSGGVPTESGGTYAGLLE